MLDYEKNINPGIYIHIPFCSSRCIYCDFYSTVLGEETKSLFVRRLIEEMSQRKSELCAHIDTVYLGGGTPSCLSMQSIEAILSGVRDNFHIANLSEITIEVNPDDVTPSFVCFLKNIGINRVSMGVQTFDDTRLRFLRRRHTSAQAIHAVHTLVENGIVNISIDLIYGFPNQSELSWISDLKQALSLPIKHLSAYSLMYEEGTVLTTMRDRGQVQEIDDSVNLEMFENLMDITSEYGMEHYEISNFSYPGFYSRHNCKYWNGVSYLGLGPGAHSFDGSHIRRCNKPDVKAYIQSYADVPHELEILDADELCDEFIFTSLRTCRGLDLGLFRARYGLARYNRLMNMSKEHISNGLLVRQNNSLCLSRRGIFLSDMIMSDLMMIE